MPLITLVENARSNSDHIIEISLHPGHILVQGLGQGPAIFTCTNDLNTIKGCTVAKIVYDASVSGDTSDDIQIYSIIA